MAHGMKFRLPLDQKDSTNKFDYWCHALPVLAQLLIARSCCRVCILQQSVCLLKYLTLILLGYISRRVYEIFLHFNILSGASHLLEPIVICIVCHLLEPIIICIVCHFIEPIVICIVCHFIEPIVICIFCHFNMKTHLI